MAFPPLSPAPRTALDQADPLSALFDGSRVAMALLDTAGALLACNPALRRLTRDAADSAGTFVDLVHANDSAAAERAMADARNGTAGASSWELRLRRPDGTGHWVLASIAPLGAGVVPPRYVLQAMDIDERKRNELELSQRESRWNHALESAGQGVWDHDFVRGEMFYSRQWKAIRGMAPDDPVEPSVERWIESVHPDDRGRVMEEIRRQEQAEAVFNVFAYREKHQRGHWVWIESRGAVVEYGPDERPSRITGTDTDVTERREAEELLARLSRRLELALDISRIGVFEANLRSGEVIWDDALLRIYGLTRNSDLAGGWEDMIHQEDRASALARVETAIRNGEPFTNEFRIVRADGEIRHVRARAAPYVDANGVPRLVGANWDVTEDVHLQQELQRARDMEEARNQELEEAKARIEHTALHDHLTGLPNRRFLDATLEAAAGRAMAGDERIAILHIDLDRFKEINDTLGHLAGDRMLIHAAAVLRRYAGPDDFVARIGGDEFVFLAAGGGGRDLAALAENIVTAMREPVTFDGHICRFGASVGIATAAGTEIDGKQLLVNADLALYRAKNKGRSRHEFFSQEIQAQIIANKKTADDILTALERGEFTAFYQPQFDARTLDVVGVETLARWRHPERGLLTPDAFLKIADDLNVVAAIDRLVLERALAEFAGWQRAGVKIPKLSANVSSRRLHDPDLAASLKALAPPAGTLSFELLESIFLDDCDRTVLDNLAEMRRLGIDIEIDDFGTGHASIVSLLKLRPRRLKIDRQLVKPITRSPALRRLVGTIIEIGRSLDIEVVGEGVETAAHAIVLRDLGCDILQGYALARPMAGEAIGDFVRDERWRDHVSPVRDLQDRLRHTVR